MQAEAVRGGSRLSWCMVRDSGCGQDSGCLNDLIIWSCRFPWSPWAWATCTSPQEAEKAGL